MNIIDLDAHLTRVVTGLNHAHTNEMQSRGNTWAFDQAGVLLRSEQVRAVAKRKWVNIDIGSSGAFMVERTTGEIYNIKAYGVPDHNKKQKANLGNIATANPETLYAKRYNYLR